MASQTSWEQALWGAHMKGQERMAYSYIKRLCATEEELRGAEALAARLGIELY